MSQKAEAKKKADKAPKPDDEEAEEVKLPVPDFDPEAYMRKEVRSAKLAVLNTGYGVLLAGVATLVQALLSGDGPVADNARFGWFTLLIGVAGLRLTYRLGGVETGEWKPKDWLAAYFTLFFSFLAFWYLFTNPPF